MSKVVLTNKNIDYLDEKIVATTEAIVLILDKNLKVQLISKGALKTFGYKQSELLGKNWFNTVVPANKFPNLFNGYSRFIKSSSKTRTITAPVICKNKSQKIIAWQTSKIFKNKELQGTIAFGKDITQITEQVNTLEADKRRFKNLADQLLHPVLIVDINGKFIFLNKAFNKQFGYNLKQLSNVKEAILKSNLNKKQTYDAVKKWESEIKNIFNTKKSIKGKIEVKTQNSETKLVEYTAMLVDNYVYYVYTDITKQIAAKQKFLQTTKTFKKITSNTPVAIAACDINTLHVLYTNSYFIKQIGYNAQELNAKESWESVFEFNNEKEKINKTKEWEKIKAALQKNKKIRVKKVQRNIRCKNGTLKIFEIGITLSEDVLYAFFYDITEQKNHELELLANEKKFRNLAEFSPYPISFIKTNGDIIFLNKAFTELFGLRMKDIPNIKTLFKVCYSDVKMQQQFYKNWQNEVKYLNYYNQVKSKEFSFTHYNDKKVYIEYSATKYRNFIYYIYINKTNYYENQILLQKANQTFNEIAKITPVSIVNFDISTFNIVFANERFYEVFGYDENEIIGRSNWRDYIIFNTPKEKQAANKRWKNLLQNGLKNSKELIKPFERNILCKNGSIKTFEIGITIESNTLYAFLYNITERKIAEEVIKESEAQFRSLAENMPIAIGAYDENKNTIFVNNHFTQITGYTLQEIATVDVWYQKTQPNPEIRKRFSEYWQQSINDHIITNKKLEPIIATSLCKDGKFRHFIYSFNVVNDITYILLIDISEQEIAKKQLQKSHEELRVLNMHLNTIREEERQKISREIHDELGQQITGIKMAASSVFNKIKKQESISNNECQSIIEMLSHSVNTVRKISTNLRPSIIDDLGIAAAVEWLVNNFRKTSQINCITYINVQHRLNSAVKNNVFRIVQESLTNIARHSKATQVNVDFFEDGNKLFLIIADNGKGFNTDVSKKTLGILGIRERATILHGNFNILSKRNNGTKIIITIPLDKAIDNELLS